MHYMSDERSLPVDDTDPVIFASLATNTVLSGMESLSECRTPSLSDITASYIAAHSSEASSAFREASNSILEVVTSKDKASEKVSIPVLKERVVESGESKRVSYLKERVKRRL